MNRTHPAGSPALADASVAGHIMRALELVKRAPGSRGDVTGARPHVCPRVATLGPDACSTHLGPARRALVTVSRVARRGWEWVERFRVPGFLVIPRTSRLRVARCNLNQCLVDGCSPSHKQEVV